MEHFSCNLQHFQGVVLIGNEKECPLWRDCMNARLGLHQCQGKYGQPVRPTGRIPFEGASVMVPPIAKHPCTHRHRWNSSPTQGPFVKRNGPAFRSFHGHPLAENVTALYSVLPVCQGGHSAQSVEYSACFQHSLASWYGQSVHAFWYPR